MNQIEDIDSFPDVSEFFGGLRGFSGTISAGSIVSPEIAEIQKALQKLAFYAGDKTIATAVDSRLNGDVVKKINRALKVWAKNAPDWMRTGKLSMNQISGSAMAIAQALVDARGEKETEAERAAAERSAVAQKEEAERTAKYGERPPESQGFCPGAKPCPSGQERTGPPDCKCLPIKAAKEQDIAKRQQYEATKAGYSGRQMMYKSAGADLVEKERKAKRLKTWIIGGSLVTVAGLAMLYVVKR